MDMIKILTDKRDAVAARIRMARKGFGDILPRKTLNEYMRKEHLITKPIKPTAENVLELAVTLHELDKIVGMQELRDYAEACLTAFDTMTGISFDFEDLDLIADPPEPEPTPEQELDTRLDILVGQI